MDQITINNVDEFLRNSTINDVRSALQTGKLDVTCRYSHSYDSILIETIKVGRSDLVDVLIDEGGAKINSKNYFGHRAIYYAIAKGDIPCAKNLLSRGAKFKSKRMKFSLGMIFFHSVNKGEMDIAQFLIDHLDVNVDIRNRFYFNMTAMFFAVRDNDYERVKFLYDAGADIHALSESYRSKEDGMIREGLTPYGFARSSMIDLDKRILGILLSKKRKSSAEKWKKMNQKRNLISRSIHSIIDTKIIDNPLNSIKKRDYKRATFMDARLAA